MKMNIEKLLDWLRRHFIFCKAVPFTLGLFTSYAIVDYAVMSILMEFYSETWHDSNLSRNAFLRNLVDGVSVVSAIVMSYVSEVYTGLFSPITFCSTASVMGLMILWVSQASSETGIGMHFMGVVLVAIGIAAMEDPLLPCFLENQLSSKVQLSNEPAQSQGHDHESREELVEFSSIIWLRISKICAAFIVIFIFGDRDWQYYFMCSSLILGATFLLFISGSYWYCPKPPKRKSPFSGIWRKLKEAIEKIELPYPRRENAADAQRISRWENLKRILHFMYGTERSHPRLLPHVPEERAAIIEMSSQSQSHQVTSAEMLERNGRLRAVRKVKSLILSLPLWLTFIACSIVQYAGNTFFVEQASNLKDSHVGPLKVGVQHFFMIKSTIRDVILLFIRWKRSKGHRFTIRGINAGMISASICCFTSGLVEMIRLSLVRKEGKNSCSSDGNVSLSILVLIPQFFLLGIMEGLALESLQQLYENCVLRSLKRLGRTFTEILSAIAMLLNVIIGLIFRFWINQCIDISHLDRYYLMLGGLCSTSFFFFAFSNAKSGLGSFLLDAEGNPYLETTEHHQGSPAHDSTDGMQAESPVQQNTDT